MSAGATFTVPGKPYGQKRHRVNFGQRRTYDDPDNVKFADVVRAIAIPLFPEPIEGAVGLHIVATFEPPKSWSNRKRIERMNKLHTSKPDADNITKAVKDALNRVAWGDDAQVARQQTIKRWGPESKTIVSIYREE